MACHSRPQVLAAPDASPAPSSPATHDHVQSESVHFSELKPFLPDRLGGFTGGEMKASTSQFGTVAVSEIDRIYESRSRRAQIRVVDTNLSRQSGAAVRPQPEGAPNARPFAQGSAHGYFSYDPQRRLAQASVIVGERFVVGITVEDAADDADAQMLVKALDLAGLGRLGAAQTPAP
jgi:hypothetical protein